MSQPPLLERLGVEYFRRLSRGATVVDEDSVHVLNERELSELRSIERGAVARAAVAGALSALVSAVAEVVAMQRWGASFGARGWALIGAATAVASIIEIAYLYWDGLRAVHRLSVSAGLRLFDDERSERLAVANALARAALELPNAPHGNYGLDAARESSKLELLVASLVYKLKTSVSNFIFKALVRRALGRTALRGYLQTLLPFVAVPVTALWNGVVAWLVVREARLRVIGPSAAHQLCRMALGDAPQLSAAASAAAVRAVGCSVVKTGDLHPNLAALLGEVVALVGEPSGVAIDDAEGLLAELPALEASEALRVLRLLCVASIMDGRISRRERALLHAAFATRGLRLDEPSLDALLRSLLAGRPLDPARVESLAASAP